MTTVYKCYMGVKNYPSRDVIYKNILNDVMALRGGVKDFVTTLSTVSLRLTTEGRVQNYPNSPAVIYFIKDP